MTIEELVRLRNFLNTAEGKLLIDYLQDEITQNAMKYRDNIVGMCHILSPLKFKIFFRCKKSKTYL